VPLKLVLRPGEKLIVNGAVLGVGDHPVSLYFYNKVNFLRGREILKEEQCDTLEKKLYFIIQLIYIFPDDAEANLVKFRLIMDEVRAAKLDAAETLDQVNAAVREGNYYRALKLCRKLFPLDSVPTEPSNDGRDRTNEGGGGPLIVTRKRRAPREPTQA
jgi:flagellar biosynthesis repressor protein FlbT